MSTYYDTRCTVPREGKMEPEALPPCRSCYKSELPSWNLAQSDISVPRYSMSKQSRLGGISQFNQH